MASIKSDTILAVALVINRSRDGPAFVFHYPPLVKPLDRPNNLSATDTSDLEDLLLERLSQPASGESSSCATQGVVVQDEHYVTDSGSQIVPWEHVAGFPANDLASILTPGRSYHKKLFQLSLDPVHCMCCPVHVPESGRWKKPKKAVKRQATTGEDTRGASNESDTTAENAKKVSTKDAVGNKKEDADEEKRSSMTMFNLVFFLDPRHGNVKETVSLLYSNVIKKMNKAFKYSQQDSEFVWKDSKRILAAKDKGREDKTRMSELWKEIIQNYSLAASVRDLYEVASQNSIASIHLETAAGILSPSVQIPVPFYISDLPAEQDQDRTGLWLSTANAFLDQEALEEPGYLDRNFALLLMSDAKKVAAELSMATDRDTASTSALVDFVGRCKPTSSFFQVAQAFPNHLTPSQVRRYAQHFIYWRRGMAIPPLHARDTYITSPNCDMSKLPQAALEWSQSFGRAPPLSTFFAQLSAAPRPYKTLCPYKVLRPQYLQMLAWLIRGGWVTQWCTFAYVIVWPEILYQVDYENEAAEIEAAAAKAAKEHGSSSSHRDSGSSSKNRRLNWNDVPLSPRSPSDLPPQAVIDEPLPSSEMRLPLSPTTRSSSNRTTSSPSPLPPLQGLNETDTSHPGQTPSAIQLLPSHATTTTEDTAEQARLARLSLKASLQAADRATLHARKQVPQPTRHPSTNTAPHLAGLYPYIIYDPKKATGKESQYLSAIASRFDEKSDGRSGADSDRIKNAWTLFCKYFDGKTALERVALLEDRKRKEVWTLLGGMSEWLLCVRHW